MSLTPAQSKAIGARGNVLVVAGAGTGKTHTLVERCLNCLLDEQSPASLGEILMVTFTEAAAVEMRQRIRDRLEAKLKELEDAQEPGTHSRLVAHLREQLGLFETAHIGTLHSFCLELVRQHFYELELDPQLAVLPQEEASLLAQETLDELLQKHYAARSQAAEAVRGLIQTEGRRGDETIRALVTRLHHYTQTRADPEAWFKTQIENFSSEEPVQWREWLRQGVADWRERWLPDLTRRAVDNEVAAECAGILGRLGKQPSPQQTLTALNQLNLAFERCPHGKGGAWLKPLANFRAESEFLASLLPGDPGADPIAEDWEWVRKPMLTMLDLVQEFVQAFTEGKRELGVVDFNDLEQYSLRLLWDLKANTPTKTALEWRRRLRFVFVDEYQDINAAQDNIITALGRDGKQANRFLVGDVKQSIYRFRLADPSIFRGYMKAWTQGSGASIPLVENFRSRERILDFANSFFGMVMREDLGGVTYDKETELRFGAPEERMQLSAAADPSPRVELHLRLKGKAGQDTGAEEAGSEKEGMLELQEAEKEAHLVALRLRELKLGQHRIYDKQSRQFRPVDWSDMAVLLRSPANKAESYAKEFIALNIPLHVERGGFYRSLEISDLVNLLRLLDNPLQDLPLLAVLHSPLVGLTTNELAMIRLAGKGPFWTTLRRWLAAQAAKVNSQSPEDKSLYRKVAEFLERYARWRRLARQASLSHCLDAVLLDTHYGEWLQTQSRGGQRQANLQRLLGLALRFDQFQRQSLFRFLCFVDAQQLAEAEPEVAVSSGENAVRLMSIHQSKGLEFPVVVLADAGKAFNLADLRGEIILDEEFGLCPRVKPPLTGKKYPSLPYWLARHRQKRELLGEELRLLYVAMTRARDTLILSAAITTKKFENIWTQAKPEDASALFSANSYADWLGIWFAGNCAAGGEWLARGENDLVAWTIYEEPESSTTPSEPMPREGTGDDVPELSPAASAKLRERLTWRYPYPAATEYPAKTSVTVLRRRAAEQMDDVAGDFAFRRKRAANTRRQETQEERSTRDGELLGVAHHSFLQHVSLACVGSLQELQAEGRRMIESGVMTAEEAALLDFRALLGLWESDLGRKIRAQEGYVRRELAFTARFSPQELGPLAGDVWDQSLENEFVVIQGVVDLAVLLEEEIWVVDFKTDRVKPQELDAKARAYEPQLNLYAAALGRIYRRQVTNCWLYFLTPQIAVPVAVPPTLVARRPARG